MIREEANFENKLSQAGALHVRCQGRMGALNAGNGNSSQPEPILVCCVDAQFNITIYIRLFFHQLSTRQRGLAIFRQRKPANAAGCRHYRRVMCDERTPITQPLIDLHRVSESTVTDSHTGVLIGLGSVTSPELCYGL